MDKVLRASKAGFPCIRNLFYAVNNFEGVTSEQTQRIFDVGNSLEPMVVEWLRKDGWTVDYNPGSQNAELEVIIPVHGGNIAGHPDCIISRGELQNVLIDIKTMNEHAFTQWRREGTQSSKPQYVTQLHIYAMGLIQAGRKVEHLGILGVNKNNSDWHMDIFSFNRIYANEIVKKAERVFAMNNAPDENCPAETWACNYCEFAHLCELHKKKYHAKEQKDVETTDDAIIIAAMRELQHARELSREAKNLEAHAKSALDEYVRSKGLSQIQGGGLSVSITEKQSSRFDTTAFKKAHPELVGQFTKSTTSTYYEIEEVLA